jgi:hypothetical protein
MCDRVDTNICLISLNIMKVISKTTLEEISQHGFSVLPRRKAKSVAVLVGWPFMLIITKWSLKELNH